MSYYRKGRYKNNYYDDGNTILVLLCLMALLISSIVSFINRNKWIIMLITFILFILIMFLLLFKNRKKIKRNIIYKKLRKSNLYEEIEKLNNEYKFESLKPFYDKYSVNKKYLLKTSNIDEYLMMTIENKYDELVEYKKEYDLLKVAYESYNQKYNNLYRLIDEAEAKKLKISKKNYLKYQPLIYKENRIDVDKEFQIVIYLNYESGKGKVKDKVYKKYDNNTFFKIYNEYKKIKEERDLYQISAKVERSVMTESMRYDVFKRDKFKCQICGATSKDGAHLQVDHIIPVSKGGKTEMSNLQTLCSRCNRGKSNKIE